MSGRTRPGGNVTGFFCDFDDAMSRLARALRDAVPATRHLVALTDGPSTEAQARALRAARAALGLDIDTLDIAVGSAETLIDRVGASHAALIVPASPRLQA